MENNTASSQPSKRDSSFDSSPDASTSHANAPDQKANADSDSRGNIAREEVKIYKTISRVHRACNACRKQKARCDGPENPPCRRCKQVGIECIFEKPPKEPASSASAAPDAGASADRIRILETQMSGMQSMISELVASIKANTSAMTASPSQIQPPPPQLSPRQSSVSSSSPHSSRASRPDPYHSHRQQSTPLQQHPYAPPPHHRSSQHDVSPSADTMQRYPPDGGVGTFHPQHPPYPNASRSFGSSNSVVAVTSTMASAPIQASSGYPLQQPPSFQTAYGHPPSRHDGMLLQQRPEIESLDGAQHHHGVWNAGANASSSSSSMPRRRSGSRVGFEDRGRSSQPWGDSNHPGSPAADSAAGLAQAGSSSAWMPSAASSHQPHRSSRHRWTSSDRAGSHTHSLDQNLTPSDGPTAGEDGEPRETDISNDQLSAPIEALRGLADAAAAAAAESEGHTSNDSSDEKQTEADNAGARSKQSDSAATPTLQLVDEGGKRSALAKQDDDSPEGVGKSPRKKRRRNTHADSPGSTAASGAGVDGKAGAGGAGSSATGMANVGSNGASALSPSSASRSGRMEAPGLVSSSPGDLVTLGLVNETDAMRLFETFQKGVPKFISIFHLEDEPMTTKEAYHHVRTTSYFLFNVMLAISAKVECGGKSPSRLYQTCMAQAKRNAKDTMFSPVAGKAAVQAMVLLAAYSENGWLSLGLSIRMAQELGLDRSFQKLMSALPSSGYIRHPQPPPPPKHLTFYHNSPSSHYTGSPTDVNSASYGAGRPAMLSKHYVRNCRAFLNLNYPLTVKTDARFISTLELLIIRETHYDAMAPYDQPVDARMLSKMRKVTEELNEWHQYWDANDADQMGPEQKELIIQATRAADTCLSISVNAKEYREMLGWAPHYTHVTAAFACVFLIKIARLFPRQVDTYGIFSNAERLASRDEAGGDHAGGD
ncbi:hypothetical protein [Sporisorium scitamineum]|uniref:Zn(2)-C6 fungal-type domain-containing protein n=1 Tax=Sporisorium scitamineum TaxID=49012 RepID=A0A0F7RRU5_9BASI|nr:hypothetical protein [Sporisorium scitamineum]